MNPEAYRPKYAVMDCSRCEWCGLLFEMCGDFCPRCGMLWPAYRFVYQVGIVEGASEPLADADPF